MEAVILAGGLGTRLSDFTKSTPKPLVRINEKPVLEYQIENLRRYHITDIILVIGHLGKKIKEYFGDGQKFGVRIRYFEEENPLGTAGALYYLKAELPKQFLLLYGDLLFDLNFDQFIAFHKQHFADCSLMVHPNDHVHDSDIMIVDQNDVVRKILKKNVRRDCYYKNCVNAGVFLFNKKVLSKLEANKKQDIEKDLIEPLISAGRVIAYKTSEYLRDMGTLARYVQVQKDVEEGIVGKKNMALQQKAVFLDCDDLLRKPLNLLTKLEELEIKDEAYKLIKKINTSEYLCILAIPQPKETIDEEREKIEVSLASNEAYLDDVVYDFSPSDLEFFVRNFTAKADSTAPNFKTDFLKNVVQKYNIDLTQSFFIGEVENNVREDDENNSYYKRRYS